MNSGFRNWVFLLGLVLPFFFFAQEKELKFDEDILGEIGMSFLLPRAHGDNFVSKGYDSRTDLTWMDWSLFLQNG